MKIIKDAKDIKGGKVIASGGFGCVFYPSLKCKNNKTRKKNTISKLMITKRADKEYNEIMIIQNKLKSISNFKDFFMVYNIDKPCEHNRLTSSDLNNFKKKCSALPKNGITYKNINTKLNELEILYVPYGGIPVDVYLHENDSFSNFYALNNSLVRLFEYGIVPMNEKNVYHCDIKDSNILVDDAKTNDTLKTRLIDWGLSTTYLPYKNNPLPEVWRTRSLQYNVPFSVILFTDMFTSMYTNYINNYFNIYGSRHIKIDKNRKILFEKKDEDKLFQFVLNYIYILIEKKSIGHYKLINKIVTILNDNKNVNHFKHEKKIIKDPKTKDTKTNNMITIGDTNTIRFICNYLTQILIHYTYIYSDNKLNLRLYLDNIFIHNIDTWGFISTYLPLLESLHENIKTINENKKKIFQMLKELFLFLYRSSIQPIKKNDVIMRLNNLSSMFNNEISKSSNKKNVNTTFYKSIKLSKGITDKTFSLRSKNNFTKKIK